MISHNPLDDSLKRKAAGRLEVGQSQAEFVNWLVSLLRCLEEEFLCKQSTAVFQRLLFTPTDQSVMTQNVPDQLILVKSSPGEKVEFAFIPPKIDRFSGKEIFVFGGIMLSSRTLLYVFNTCTVNGKRFNCQVIYSQFGLAIHQNDHQARRRFVEWAQNEIAVVPDFNKRILFSDEAHFLLNDYVNKQNCRIWSEANPQVYLETPLHLEELIVWCALWAGGILLQKQ
ncbi:hypothetical protein TNCV_3655261 [Trichonephila clavipes]|nr:hypothetical protein TNCV_3655261 [Trichonephila clavipes]